MENSATIVYFGSLGNKVEGRYFCQKNNTAPTILILPPDPRYGGTMNNEIVKLLERVFQKCGFSTLAINYQGSGKSDGNFTRATDGIVTASVALDWLQLHNRGNYSSWQKHRQNIRIPYRKRGAQRCPQTNTYGGCIFRKG